MKKLKFEKQSISSLDRNEMAKLNGGKNGDSTLSIVVEGSDVKYCLLDDIVVTPSKEKVAAQ